MDNFKERRGKGVADSALYEPLVSSSEQNSPVIANNTAQNEIDDSSCLFPFCCRRSNDHSGVNKNLFFTFSFTSAYALTESIWEPIVYVVFVKELTDSNTFIGLLGFIFGIFSIPVYKLSWFKKLKRSSRLITVGGICIMTSLILDIIIIASIGCDDEEDIESVLLYFLIFLSSILSGIGNGVVEGPVMELFYESAVADKKQKYEYYYSILYICSYLAASVGTTLSLILFVTFGNEWDLCELKTIFILGLVLTVPTVIPLFFLTWKNVSRINQGEINSNQSVLGDDNSKIDKHERESSNILLPSFELKTKIQEVTVEELMLTSADGNDPNNGCPSETSSASDTEIFETWGAFISIQSYISDFGFALIEIYLPLYFKEKLGWSPVQVQLAYLISHLVAAITIGWTNSIAYAVVGRIQMITVFKAGAVLFFLLFVIVGEQTNNWYIIVILYTVYSAFNYSKEPLEDLFHDELSSHDLLDNVLAFSAPLATLLGGLLSDTIGYQELFIICLAIQSVGLASNLYLLAPMISINQMIISVVDEDHQSSDVDDTSKDYTNPRLPLFVGKLLDASKDENNSKEHD